MQKTTVLKDWASLVIATAKGKIVLVLDQTKKAPHYWKLPGGHGEEGEAPIMTACRELLEETGIKVKNYQLSTFATQDQKRHTLFVFKTELENFLGVEEYGSTGEMVKVFPISELENIGILPQHVNLLKDLIPKAKT